jgi:molecular chaperone GrpE
VTSRRKDTPHGKRPAEPDAVEPAGDQDATNEAEIEGAAERAGWRPERDEAGSERAERSEAGGETGPADAGPDPSGDGAAPPAESEELPSRDRAEDVEGEDPLADLRSERDRYLELAQRTQADFENYRKRAAKEAAAAGERAKGGLVRELLPVVDNLERALATASSEESQQHLAEGVRLVHQELMAVLQRNGAEQFDPKGEAFDPEVHEALSTRTEDGADPGIVLDVVEKGYKLNGTVLRPARVVVSG